MVSCIPHKTTSLHDEWIRYRRFSLTCNYYHIGSVFFSIGWPWQSLPALDHTLSKITYNTTGGMSEERCGNRKGEIILFLSSICNLNCNLNYLVLVLHFYTPIKYGKTVWFSGVFRGYRNVTLRKIRLNLVFCI